jgi:hypothetical protein
VSRAARNAVSTTRRISGLTATVAHDWLEVTELTPPEEPVELLVAPELVEPVTLDEVVSLLPDAVTLDEVVSLLPEAAVVAHAGPARLPHFDCVFPGHGQQNRGAP